MNLSITLEQPGKRLALFGSADRHLRMLREAFAVQVVNRDDELRISGEPDAVQRAAAVLDGLQKRLRRQDWLSLEDVSKAIAAAAGRGDDGGPGRAAAADEVEVFSKGGHVRAKTDGQRAYLDAIFKNDLTVCTGPAGTGKTYLAVAAAAALLKKGAAKRLVLARPAVEAGERLGFLPGDLQAKVNPYLRPLFDALHDMMDVEQVRRLMVNDVIEVVPLAFMRGRAQPLTSQVLTPFGFRDIGSVCVGDLVIGSDGQPTRVLGVYPQGVKDVFRVTFADGATTRCCPEHLWTVRTKSDADWDVVEAADLRERMGQGERFEIPVLSGPVQFDDRRHALLTETDRRRAVLAEAAGGDGEIEAVMTAADGLSDADRLAPAVTRAALLGDLIGRGDDDRHGLAFCTSATYCESASFLARSLGLMATTTQSRDDGGFELSVELPTDAVREPRRIATIEADGRDDCVCIRVAAPDALYVTDDFILTHNTLSESVIILDEAQNTTVSQMLMFLTRLGQDSKMIVTGDASQVDLPDGTPSGLADAVQKLRGIDHVGLVQLDHSDIVRHRLVQAIVNAYEQAGRPILHRRDVDRDDLPPTLPL